jgi:DNA-binding NtrC family response regulator/CBS domain-containing protein
LLVSEIMRRDFYTLHVDDTLGHACEIMDTYRLYGAPVVDDKKVIQGIFTRPHLIRAFIQSRELNTPIEELMQQSATTIDVDCDISEAIKLFVDHGYHNIPVKDKNNVLIGVLLSSDLLQIATQEFYRLFGTHQFDYLGNAMIGIDSKGYIRSVSETALSVFGPQAASIINKHVFETIPLLENISVEILSDAQKSKELYHQLSVAQKRVEYYRNELQSARGGKYTFSEIIGMSPQMKKMRVLAAQAAKTTSTVLIHGESGTGKELLAQAIHNASARCNEPLIKVNCAAIPEHLMESELFGYCDGAFTGAVKGGKPGKFELAHGGSIFLDEIGDMHPSIQAKLLRVLQEFEFERLGGTKTINVDVRVIAATNRNLKELIVRGNFRNDLFYRLNVINIVTVPLRERREDIDYLTDYLVENIADRLNVVVTGIDDSARRLLRQYDYPGNVRELENILERAVNIINGETNVIRAEHLSHLAKDINVPPGETNSAFFNQTLEEVMHKAEKEAILQALIQTRGNRNEAAKLLNIHRSLLYKKLKKYEIS